MDEIIWVFIKAQFHINLTPIVNLLGLYVPIVGKSWGPINNVLILSGLRLQTVPLSTLDKCVVLPQTLTESNSHMLGEIDTYNIDNHLGAC